MAIDDQCSSPLEIEDYRNYLRLLAGMQLNPRLKSKEDVSDIVQQTMLEAHLDKSNFRGKTDTELRAWLTRILINNVVNTARYYGRGKRNPAREISLHEQMEQSSALLHRQLADQQSTPSESLMKQERSQQIALALLQLLEPERDAILLKYYHRWPINEIAQHLGRSGEAVAGLLRRGLIKLRNHISAES